jgi:hypothetical protein
MLVCLLNIDDEKYPGLAALRRMFLRLDSLSHILAWTDMTNGPKDDTIHVDQVGEAQWGAGIEHIFFRVWSHRVACMCTL